MYVYRIKEEITRGRLKVIQLQKTMKRSVQLTGHVKRMGHFRLPRIALEKLEERNRKTERKVEGCGERGMQKRQMEEEETWWDSQKVRRLYRTTPENGNIND